MENLAIARKMFVVKRTGEIVDFDEARIGNAILKAVKSTGAEITQAQLTDLVNGICNEIEDRFLDFYPNVENVQDVVEKHLVKKGHYEIGKEYILYRARRQKEREEERKLNMEKARLGRLRLKKKDGKTVLFDINKVKAEITNAARGFEKDIQVDLVAKEVLRNIYDGIGTVELRKALVLASVTFIEKDPAYSFVSGRLFLQSRDQDP